MCCLFNEIVQRTMKLNPSFLLTKSDFITQRFHPTEVGFIPSARTDLVEKNPHLSTTSVGSFLVEMAGVEPASEERLPRALRV